MQDLPPRSCPLERRLFVGGWFYRGYSTLRTRTDLGSYRGTSIKKNAFASEPTVGLSLGPYGGPRVWAFSCERGTPVLEIKNTHRPRVLHVLQAFA